MGAILLMIEMMEAELLMIEMMEAELLLEWRQWRRNC